MIASTPWSTAVAASLTSARVGRGSARIDSSTCVARITGRPSGAGARDDRLLNARDLLERHLQPEIAARHHHAVRDLENRVEDARAPAGRSIFAIIGTSRFAARMIAPRRRQSSGVWTKLSATMSTPSVEAELQIVFVLVVTADAGSGRRAR